MKNKQKKIGDYYWAYADILRGIGVPENMYDQRILAFMALKLVVDNELVSFNFDYKNNFGLTDDVFDFFKESNFNESVVENSTKNMLKSLITNISSFTRKEIIASDSPENWKITKNCLFQSSLLNPGNSENVLSCLSDPKVFDMISYIDELEEHYLEMVLDIYMEKADFRNYPKEKYKDLYEITISRMKKMTGTLTGQHFTQKSVIHLMCESVVDDFIKDKKEKLAIYDPTCGTGSMLMESVFYFDQKLNFTKSGKRKKKQIQFEVYGQEYNPQTWLLAKIFLEISGIKNEISCGNTLTNPAFDHLNGNDSFDFIIANPPFGVDWKHDYEAVIKDLEKLDDSNFSYEMLSDEKGNIVLPKKSDGQFLFVAHIVKLLETSRKAGKRAKAACISSTGLLTSGKDTSGEGLIRKNMFSSGIVDAVIEQPGAMFTNTDISTLIWFLDNNEKSKNKTYAVKVDPSYVNKDFKDVGLKILFSNAEHKIDKQKNGYSEADIKRIISLIEDKRDFKPFAKTIEFKDSYTVNFNPELDIKENKIYPFSVDDLEAMYGVLNLSLIIGSNTMENRFKGFKEIEKDVGEWINKSFLDSLAVDFEKAYLECLDKGSDLSEKLDVLKNMMDAKSLELFKKAKTVNEKFTIGLV